MGTAIRSHTSCSGPHFPPADRQVIDFKRFGISDVLALGRYEYHTIKPGLASHSHPNAVEISYLERGQQIYCANGQEYRLVGGDLFVTAPGEAHGTGDQPENCGILYWLILRIPQQGESLLMLPSVDSATIAVRLSHLPQRQFPGKPILKRIFQRLFEIHGQVENELSRVTVVNHLLSCVLEVIHCGDRYSELRCSPQIEEIAKFIRQHPEEEFSLPELAKKTHLSLSRFKTRFKAEIGLGPHEFVLCTRIDAAKQALLQDKASVTDTAMRFGFSSSQYFATVFKRFTRTTPVQFRSSGGSLIVPLRVDSLLPRQTRPRAG